MAIILYRKGGFKICDEFSFTHELENGWFLSKTEAEAETEVESEVESKVKPEIEPEVELELKRQSIIEKLKAKKLELTEELEEDKG